MLMLSCQSEAKASTSAIDSNNMILFHNLGVQMLFPAVPLMLTKCCRVKSAEMNRGAAAVRCRCGRNANRERLRFKHDSRAFEVLLSQAGLVGVELNHLGWF